MFVKKSKIALLIKKEREKEELQVPHENDSLARELAFRLQKQLPDWKWAWQKLSFVHTPVLQMTSPGGKKFILPFDGFIAQTPYTNFAWEAEMQFRLKSLGYEILPVSINQLVQDPARTCLRLTQKLGALDIQEEEE